MSDWIQTISAYQPESPQQAADRLRLLEAAAQYGDTLLLRSCPGDGHVTCSGFVMDESLDYVLMAYHNIYRSFAWTGGHADGDPDLRAVAIREAQEETGIAVCEPISSVPLSVEILPVAAHEKHGVPVAEHVHYNVSYGLIGRRRDPLRIRPDENSAVQWIPADRLADYCTEPEMLPVYQRLIDSMRRLFRQQEELLRSMQQPLLQWYRTQARDLPWRRDREPYHVWLSEIMLQQTRVEAVKTYYTRFLAALPDVQALAAAPPEQLHKLWEGLGYYTRVRNLQKAAQQICDNNGGRMPDTWEAWHSLPGVGTYTAGAVCSICFGLPCAAVDGNVLRVVMRLWDAFTDITRNGVRDALTKRLSAAYPADDPEACGMLTQAWMELGATVCVPNGAPHCTECPLAELCQSNRHGSQLLLPKRTPKTKRTISDKTVLLLRCGERYAIRKRPAEGLLAGLWEFPNTDGCLTPQEAIDLASTWGCKPLELVRTATDQHIFTHLTWNLHVTELLCGEPAGDFCWATRDELQQQYALPTAFRKLLP